MEKDAVVSDTERPTHRPLLLASDADSGSQQALRDRKAAQEQANLIPL